MIRRMLFGLILGCIGLCSAAQRQGTAGGNRVHAKRPVTVADAIEMTQIADHPWYMSGNVAHFSPDGSKFVCVTQKGNLKNNTVEFSLLVFKTAEAFASARPETVATLASSSNRKAIRQVQWLSDNETIAFLGEQPEEFPQLYKVSTKTKKLEKLTNHPMPIVAYSMSERGANFVYVAEASPRPVLSDEMRRRGFFVTSQQWDDLYTNRRGFDTRHEIYVKTPRIKMPQRVGGVFDLYPFTVGLSISPNGKYALLRAYRTSPPLGWEEYQYRSDAEVAPSIPACSAGEVARCPEQFYVVDLNDKTIEPLLNAPIVRRRKSYEFATWTRQSSVLLVNVMLPLDSVDGEERKRRLIHVYAAEVTLPERSILTISERREPYSGVFFIESDRAKDRIILKTTGVSTLGPPLEFRKEGNAWKVVEIKDIAPEPEDPFSVTTDQDINSPPRLVVNDAKMKRNAVLLDLNPQFSQLTFGHVEIFPWKTRAGQWGEGTLYYPPDYVPGRRYPLIIQTHEERRDLFWIDGPYSTAYAAQPLANKGFLVLQMGLVDGYEKASVDEVYKKFFSTSQEGPYYTALFESAIDELDRRGLIDRTRVGLSGFSRTAYHVLYALTHSQYQFAAAVAADGVNFGYVNCIFSSLAQPQCEKMNGGLPYGTTLSNWVKEAPTFRLDKIQAPLLLQAILAPVDEWEIFSGLRWLKKPAEMLSFYPEGEHELVQPQQRLLSQGSVVDWYCFWLKGETDPNPLKTDQYARWRKMKQDRDEKAAQTGN